ncbi:MAG: tRNA (adenosine(37)-N6)-threonylcarbamoyltransferase complex ATPase subunit type 1 TsaE [Opitutales bacterium]|nr:tRNA (adenosine(37)-N6)-threonylcarbamoyltransferase complex ATPase subunit type 1 TsaE [Opitutales bacterium]
MEAVGAALARSLPDDQWLCLAGDLGAGKTTFARGFARGLGVREDITSPTFAIYSFYQGAPRQLLHMDAYRLHGPDDIEALMLDDFLRSPFTVLLEWPERIVPALPPDARFLQFASIDEQKRRLTLLDGPPGSPESDR